MIRGIGIALSIVWGMLFALDYQQTLRVTYYAAGAGMMILIIFAGYQRDRRRYEERTRPKDPGRVLTFHKRE